ncbi:hypothetical protein GPECTOR_26g561 [Gonium pectorale]|uniref:Uncharacterized protein n=1 Tax=Gonium pectorale TaxID=33097 RepID=A0A150GFP2_GONPE|nr:hypothetical protein GPECTOR_26g561 [Gonium pectorale]|eukprot:KXZ48658.1 hypothetical protein GPECTOR_26g561 [Gonium pectorale]
MAPRHLLGAALLACSLSLVLSLDSDFTFGTTRVRFLGNSPNFQVYPNTSLTSYLQLKFQKFEERDTDGKKVGGHGVTSLASADPTWTTGNYTAKNGANLTYVKMTLDPTNRNEFTLACPTNGNSGRRSLRETAAQNAGRSLLAASPKVVVTMFFGGANDSTFQYGYNKTVTVAKGGIKFSVEYSDWPFCNDNNTLGMEIDILLKGDAAATGITTATNSDGTKVLTIPVTNDTTSSLSFANYAYEASNGNRSMSVSVDLSASATKATITLKLPNPKPNTTVYYDPTVTTTITATPGAAGVARVTLWALLAAVLLSLLLS